MKPLKFPIILILLLSALSLNAQRIVPIASISNNRILIGEQVKLRLELQLTPGLNAQFGDVKLPEQIEILSKTPSDTILQGNTNFLYMEMIITAFDSGNYTIPPLSVIANGDTFFSKKLKLQVASVNVDTSGAIKDIISPLEPGFSFKDWVADHIELITGFLAIILMGYLLFYFIRKDRIEQLKRAKTPYELAIEQLNNLNELDHDDVKSYYMLLTLIVREYIEKQFGIPAMEQTTKEIIANLAEKKFSKSTITNLKELLSLSDKVKFAKLNPESKELKESYKKALDFINLTKPVEKEEELSNA